MKELKMLYKSTNESGTVLYLYNQENSAIVPIEYTEPLSTEVNFVIKAISNLVTSNPPILEIYKYLDESFYAYLVLNSVKRNIKICLPEPLLGLMATDPEIKVVIKESVLRACGIQVTSEIIENCLLG